MYSRDLVQKVRQMYSKKKNYHEVARDLRLRCSTVHFMVNNDYSRPKRQPGPKKKIDRRLESRIKAEVKSLQRKIDKITASKILNELLDRPQCSNATESNEGARA